MTPEQVIARQALRWATVAVLGARTDFDRAVACHSRAQAARALRSALNVEKRLPCFLRKQA